MPLGRSHPPYFFEELERAGIGERLDFFVKFRRQTKRENIIEVWELFEAFKLLKDIYKKRSLFSYPQNVDKALEETKGKIEGAIRLVRDAKKHEKRIEERAKAALSQFDKVRGSQSPSELRWLYMAHQFREFLDAAIERLEYVLNKVKDNQRLKYYGSTEQLRYLEELERAASSEMFDVYHLIECLRALYLIEKQLRITQ